MSSCAVVIPIYNERERFSLSEFDNLLGFEELTLIVIDDGSSDDLLEFLQQKYLHKRSCRFIRFSINQGKSEAVRKGISIAMEDNFDFIGVLDGDFSYSAKEFKRLLEYASFSDVDVVSGVRTFSNSKSLLLSLRLWQGLAFRYFVNVAFFTKFRDIQCGLKIFKSTSISIASLETPFINAWLYDLELLLRNQDLMRLYREVELNYWEHKPLSNLKLAQVPKILLCVLRLRFKYGRMKVMFDSK